MIDLNMGALALGGVAATVGVFWQQAKTIFAYLSSYVIVTASLSYNTSIQVRRYLKGSGRWYRLPGGDISYAETRANIEGRPASDLHVPLRRKLGSSNIMVRKWAVIFVSGGDAIHIRGIRGLTNFDKLISEVIDWTAFEDEGTNRRHGSRFAIYNTIGTEKGAWASERNNKTRGSALESDSPAVEGGGLALDVDLDVSFKYPRELWTLQSNADPFEHLYYPPEILHHVDVLRRWLTKGDWYKERGIPWRRGLLLHGPAGTGKSSLARAIGVSLDLPIHVFHLSTLSDQEFIENWNQLGNRCIVLFEDFDTVFNKRESQTSHGSLTFECILNCLSGVSTSGGIILIVTTNHLEKIDDAMVNRPGRIDACVEVGAMLEQQRTKMATRMLGDWPWLVSDLVLRGDGMAGAQFQDLCVQAAFTAMAEDETKVVSIDGKVRPMMDTEDLLRHHAVECGYEG